MKSKTKVFASQAVTPESLQGLLWETMQKVRNKKLKPQEANTMIMAAKEICNSARLELQYKILNGDFPKSMPVTERLE